MKSTCWDTRATDSIIKSGQKDTEASIMMEEVSLEASPKNIIIEDLINSVNSMNRTESTNTNILKM